jgi:hypothetical protein
VSRTQFSRWRLNRIHGSVHYIALNLNDRVSRLDVWKYLCKVFVYRCEKTVQIICSWEESNQTRILKIVRYLKFVRARFALLSLFRSCRAPFSLTPLLSYHWELRKRAKLEIGIPAPGYRQGLNVAASRANFCRRW